MTIVKTGVHSLEADFGMNRRSNAAALPPICTGERRAGLTACCSLFFNLLEVVIK